MCFVGNKFKRAKILQNMNKLEARLSKSKIMDFDGAIVWILHEVFSGLIK